MFYWIQTYLTRHFKWLIVILLAVLIVSFVFTIGNFSPLGGGGPRYVDQPFFGYDLSSEKGHIGYFQPRTGQPVYQHSLLR